MNNNFSTGHVPGLVGSIPSELRPYLDVMTDDEGTLYMSKWMNYEWVQHPDGFMIFVPKGGEQFFTILEPAIRRYPKAFVAEISWNGDLFECLTVGEHEEVLAWLESVLVSAPRWKPMLNEFPPLLQTWAKAMRDSIMPRVVDRRSLGLTNEADYR